MLLHWQPTLLIQFSTYIAPFSALEASAKFIVTGFFSSFGFYICTYKCLLSLLVLLLLFTLFVISTIQLLVFWLQQLQQLLLQLLLQFAVLKFQQSKYMSFRFFAHHSDAYICTKFKHFDFFLLLLLLKLQLSTSKSSSQPSQNTINYLYIDTHGYICINA